MDGFLAQDLVHALCLELGGHNAIAMHVSRLHVHFELLFRVSIPQSTAVLPIDGRFVRVRLGRGHIRRGQLFQLLLSKHSSVVALCK